MDVETMGLSLDMLFDSSDPTLGLGQFNDAEFNTSDVQMWENLCLPSLSKCEPDCFLDNLLNELQGEQLEQGTDEHSYAVPSMGAQSPQSSDSGLSSAATDVHSRLSPSTTSGRSSWSESSDTSLTGMMSMDILETATQDILDTVSPTPEMLDTVSPPPAPPLLRPPARTVVRFKPALRAPTSSSSRQQNYFSPYTAKDAPVTPITTLNSSAVRTNPKNGRKYPPLILSEEEKRLSKKEGIILPSHYPLTKAEERELKRIKRKIRNKRSAQTSRKRKQDYIEALEDRVEDCTQENLQLKYEVDRLNKQNQSIVGQLRKLQALVGGGAGAKRTAQTGTCLAVLLLSLCLIVAPSLSPFPRKTETESDQRVLAADVRNQDLKRAPLAGRSRTLMELPAGMLGPLPAAEDEDVQALIDALEKEALLTPVVISNSRKRSLHADHQQHKHIKLEPLVAQMESYGLTPSEKLPQMEQHNQTVRDKETTKVYVHVKAEEL